MQCRELLCLNVNGLLSNVSFHLSAIGLVQLVMWWSVGFIYWQLRVFVMLLSVMYSSSIEHSQFWVHLFSRHPRRKGNTLDYLVGNIPFTLLASSTLVFFFFSNSRCCELVMGETRFLDLIQYWFLHFGVFLDTNALYDFVTLIKYMANTGHLTTLICVTY